MNWSPLNVDHTPMHGEITPRHLMVRDAAFRWRVTNVILIMPDPYRVQLFLVMCLENSR